VTEKKITYLDMVPVRYSGSVPSMSRRGGVRLNPVTDGTINMQAAQQYLRTRDSHGQKLRDVTDPRTGMYLRSVSALESTPNYGAGMAEPASPPISGNPTGTLRMLASSVRLDAAGNKVYLDEAGRRIRTTDMGEVAGAAVPRQPDAARTTRKPRKGRTVNPRGANGGTPRVPGTTSGGAITDSDVVSYIRAMVKVKTGRTDDFVITDNMMRDGREALKIARKKAQIALAKASNNGS
jgi:hypothetical protein